MLMKALGNIQHRVKDMISMRCLAKNILDGSCAGDDHVVDGGRFVPRDRVSKPILKLMHAIPEATEVVPMRVYKTQPPTHIPTLNSSTERKIALALEFACDNDFSTNAQLVGGMKSALNDDLATKKDFVC